MVEFEEGDGGYLREERLQDGWIGRDNGLEEAEDGILPTSAGLSYRAGGRGRCLGAGTGLIVPEEVRLALLLRAHAWWRPRVGGLAKARPGRQSGGTGRHGHIQKRHAEDSKGVCRARTGARGSVGTSGGSDCGRVPRRR